MTIDVGAMKILKIENGNGFYRISEEAEWVEIDRIDKEGLMGLLDAFLTAEVEIDDIAETSLHNQAQQIIYKKIAEKLSALSDKRSKFKDESDRMYLNAIQKYSKR